MDLPVDLTDAKDLLEVAATSKNHVEKTRAFEDAIDILNDSLSDNPESTHKVLIKNLKQTYSRKLIESLPEIMPPDIDIWFQYLKIFSLKVKPEVEKITESNPILRTNYKEFVECWRKEVIEIFNEV